MSIETIIDSLVGREGRFVNHPNDRGGATNWGITIKTLEDWRGAPVTVADVRNLSQEEAKEIYKVVYLVRPRIAELIDLKLRELVFDFGVNSGVGAAIKALQGVIGTVADGRIGDKTLQAANYASQPQLVRIKLIAARMVHTGEDITENPRQADFAAGWAKRQAELLIRLGL